MPNVSQEYIKPEIDVVGYEAIEIWHRFCGVSITSVKVKKHSIWNEFIYVLGWRS